MTPFIAKLIERSCVTAHANCPLDDLIAILAKRRIGTVVVVDRDQQVIGIVSERDIIRHLSTASKSAFKTTRKHCQRHRSGHQKQQKQRSA